MWGVSKEQGEEEEAVICGETFRWNSASALILMTLTKLKMPFLQMKRGNCQSSSADEEGDDLNVDGCRAIPTGH